MLRDAKVVLVRPIRPEDRDKLWRAIQTADAETLRRRFLGGPPPMTQDLLRHLVEVDHVRREALGAFTEDGRLVDHRYDALDDTTAEVAIAVDSEWRHTGVAAALLTRLLRTALTNGITRVHVDYYATNREVEDLVRHLAGSTGRTMTAGVVTADIDLDAASCGIAATRVAWRRPSDGWRMLVNRPASRLGGRTRHRPGQGVIRSTVRRGTLA